MKEYKPDPLFEAWKKANNMASEVERVMLPIRTNAPGTLVDDFKIFTYSGALWLQEEGLIGIEAEDESKIYYRLRPEVSQELFDYCVNYWADQAARIDALLHEGMALRAKAMIADFDVNSLPAPEDGADVSDWEIYYTQLKIKIIAAESKRECDTIEQNIKNRNSMVMPTPVAPKKASAGGVVIAFLLMLIFAIFLAYACFVR